MSKTQNNDSNTQRAVSMEPPPYSPLVDVRSFTFKEEADNTIAVLTKQALGTRYSIVPPTVGEPYYSILHRSSGKLYWELKTRADSPKGRPTPAWDITDQQSAPSPMTYEENLNGYVTSYNGKVFLWKMTNGGGLYCVEGLNSTGTRVAEHDVVSNSINIDVSRRESAEGPHTDSTRFETFMILTGYIVMIEIQKLEKMLTCPSLVPSWASSLLCCGCFCA
ncbi:8292_t:CDS:1 [Paraglomus occultum]|uniref:8292_t:CDS:1 n=1 Tax=Paraglomus occultum TaxID=144539 RepID=A0A9N8WRC6_9GLOM|nr:8292_t:CDS:1 [Paraglomus occultum]